ncbi:phosphoribosylformylglycinamidine synthase I [candidate division LCP-89 bacterium B3_LCP]|uniref:Phosphoribosylformylglycinamidine synthase subunit PurQ n=1 Tax=candidate division LCP-89 bacterium B3_LCP TaxID=2012998 RepID=A0A532UZE2_UNCL8|nr:MAG: phosphoribosylformylglycinamidine synthase I [candidate division LCP-89 bacterium B3_LCP]
MRFGIVVFPGSNCDYDCYYGLKNDLAYQVQFLWHRQRDLDDIDCVILPGGFAYGDYLRAGAIARFSPIMDAVVKHAQSGKPVIGICNGFQVLTEIGLLPGALLRNDSLRFIHRPVSLRVEQVQADFTSAYHKDQVIELPIAHGQGKYYAPPDVIDSLEENNRILFRYSNPKGELSPAWNPNGSVNQIAGICNDKGNVMGMMPHPERRLNAKLGYADGQALFQAVATASL